MTAMFAVRAMFGDRIRSIVVVVVLGLLVSFSVTPTGEFDKVS